MNDVKKQVFASIVIASTIVWTMGLALLPVAGQAATLVGGDLIKASSPAVYYYMDGKRYVFPNETAYTAWYSDFSSVKTITDAELANIAIGGNVVIKAGTKLVKITTDPKVYAVEPGGILRHVASEDIAKGLYGNDWAKRVVDVPDMLFTNYTIGDAISTVVPPKGSLVNDGAKTYYINALGLKQEVDAAGMAANMFRSEFVLNLGADKIAGIATGAVLGAQDATIINAAQKAGGTTPVPPVTSGDVTVTMSSKTPASMAVPAGAAYAKMICLDIKNNASGSVKLESIGIKRSGILADNQVTGVTVTDKDGILHGSSVTIGETLATVYFGTEPIEILAGATEVACVNANISGAVATGTVAFQVVNAAAIKFNGAIVVNGVFPINGPLMNIVAANTVLGNATVASVVIAAAARDVDQGAKDVEITKFRITETTGNEPIEVMSLNVNNRGTGSDSDIKNLRVYDQNGKLLATVASMVSNKVKFAIRPTVANGSLATEIGPNGGYKISAGQQRILTVRADAFDRSNSGDKTILLVVETATEVMALGTNSAVGVTIAAAGVAAPDVFPIGLNGASNSIRFKQGTLTLAAAQGTLTGFTARGATNVKLATFDLTAFGEDIEVQRVQYVIRKTAAAGSLIVGSTALTGTIRLEVDGGGSLFSQSALTLDNYGTVAGAHAIANNLIATNAANGLVTEHILNNYLTIKAGETKKLNIVVDIPQIAAGTDSYTAFVGNITGKRLGSNTIFTTAAFDIAGNVIQVDASTLTVSRNSSFNPVVLVKGGSQKKIGSFVLRAGNAEAIRVSTVQLRLCRSFAAGATVIAQCADVDTLEANAATDLAVFASVSNITLQEGTTVLSTPFNISTVAGYNASLSQDLTIPAGQTKTVDVYANVATTWPNVVATAALTFIGLGMDVTSATGVASSQAVPDLAEVYSLGIQMTGNGVVGLSGINDGNVNVSRILHASEVDVEVYKFVLTASNAEDMIIDKMYFAVRNGVQNVDSFKLFKLGNPATQINAVVSLVGVPGTQTGEVRFSNLALTVPKAGVVSMVVKISTNTAGSMDLVNNSIDMAVTYMEHRGAMSGNLTKVSGGVATAAVDAGNGTVTVNDITLFSTSTALVPQAIRIDWNNDGDFADNNDNVNEATTYFVCAVLPAGTIELGTNNACGAILNIGGVASFVAGARISNAALVSNVAIAHEVELVMAPYANATGKSSSDTQVGTFVFGAQGSRNLDLNRVSVTLNGYWKNGGNDNFGPKNFRMQQVNSDGTLNPTVLATAQLRYVPTGLDAPLIDLVAGYAIGSTTMAFNTGTAGRNMAVGDRISFAIAAGNCGVLRTDNSGLGYRITQVTAGVAGTVTVTPGVKVALVDNDIICPMADVATFVDDTAALTHPIGSTVINLAAVAGIQVGDLATFIDTQVAQDVILNNGGLGYRVTAIAANTVTITPALEAAITDSGAANVNIARFDGNAIANTAIPEVGAQLTFVPATALVVGANDSNIYAIVAADTSMPAAQDTANLSLSIAGTKGTAVNSNGVIWGYTNANSVAVPNLNISDSYSVTGRTILYP